jgi:hypothetical protein
MNGSAGTGLFLGVSFHQQSWGGNGDAVFNLTANTWSLLPDQNHGGDYYWAGHNLVGGNGKFINAAGSVDGRDSRGLLMRSANALMDTAQYLFFGQPPSTTNNWCDAEHSSWFNSLTNPLAPVLDSRYTIAPANCGNVAWTGEIVAAAVDGSNTVYRFAHNHNDEGTGGVCYYAESFAQISNDGRYALFSSPWGGKLGTEASNGFGCGVRIDTFIVELR